MITGKYRPLHQFLATLNGREWRTTFTEIERILRVPLPPSARKWTIWWENGGSHSQARAWLEAGWEVRSLDIGKESVVFSRARRVSAMRRGKEKDSSSQEPREEARQKIAFGIGETLGYYLSAPVGLHIRPCRYYRA